MILETKRLKIREFREGDLDALAPILADSKVMKYSLSGPLTKEGARDYLDKILANYEKYGYGFWAILSKETKKMIGLIGPLKQEIDGEECVEIGYRIVSSEWGKGYASEAVEAVKNHLFLHLNLDHLIAIIEPANVRSVRVAEKMGFRLAKKTTFHGFNVGIYEIKQNT